MIERQSKSSADNIWREMQISILNENAYRSKRTHNSLKSCDQLSRDHVKKMKEEVG